MTLPDKQFSTYTDSQLRVLMSQTALRPLRMAIVRELTVRKILRLDGQRVIIHAETRTSRRLDGI